MNYEPVDDTWCPNQESKAHELEMSCCWESVRITIKLNKGHFYPVPRHFQPFRRVEHEGEESDENERSVPFLRTNQCFQGMRYSLKIVHHFVFTDLLLSAGGRE